MSALFYADRRAIFVSTIAGMLGASTQAAAKPSLPRVSPATIIAKYGKPDKVTSSETERPRPPIVSQFLEYKKEGVRFMLIADAPAGSPPPYAHWLFFGVSDLATNKPLKADEVARRMAPRLKK